MIIWGSGGKVVELGSAGTAQCPTCEQPRAFRDVLAYRYAHVWYLFSWVTRKQYMTVCSTCSHGVEHDSKAFEAKLDKSPIPFYRRYGGLVLLGLIALIVILGVVSASRISARDTELLAHPQVGDLYTVDLSAMAPGDFDGHAYGVMRVVAVDGDQVRLQVPQTGYSKWQGADRDTNGKARSSGYYADEVRDFSVARLQQLHAAHDLRHVLR